MKIGNRDIIMHIIEHFPGIRYKELVRISRLSHGTVSYHLKILEKQGLIHVERNRRISRFYSLNIDSFAFILIKECRNKTRREIINYLVAKNKATLEEIAKYVKKSRTTVSWHIRRLANSDLLIINKNNRIKTYALKHKNKIKNILERYAITFIQN